MFIIKQREFAFKTLLQIVFLEFIFVEKTTSNQRICGNSTGRNISYFLVGNYQVEWTEAWRLCSDRNYTLPVICNQDEQNALTNYLKANQLIGRSAVWTSGKKISFNEWKWVNGREFLSGAVETNKSDLFTHVVLNQSREYEAKRPSLARYYYLCQYSGSSCKSDNDINVTKGCVRPSGDARKWYDARNQCLKNGGDLAILTDADLIILRGRNKLYLNRSYWIGLRKNAWHWKRQITEPSDNTDDEIKYSNWSNDPNTFQRECISINAENGGWNAVGWTGIKKVVCQKNSDETTLATATIRTMSRTWSAKERIYSGVGAGMVIVIVCIIAIVVSVKYSRKPNKDINQSKIRSNFEMNRLNLSPKNPANSPANSPANETANSPANETANSPANETANAPVTVADDSRGVYAKIALSTLNQLENDVQSQLPGIVYVSLELQKRSNVPETL